MLKTSAGVTTSTLCQPAFVVDGTGVVESSSSPMNLQNPPMGKGAQTIQMPFFLLVLEIKLGPHAHRELIHPELEQPGYTVMAQLMENHSTMIPRSATMMDKTLIKATALPFDAPTPSERTWPLAASTSCTLATSRKVKRVRPHQ